MGFEVDLLVYVSTGEETNGTHVELVVETLHLLSTIPSLKKRHNLKFPCSKHLIRVF